MTTKLAIAIDLNQLRALMRQFIDDRMEYGEQTETELTFEIFLQWLAGRRATTTKETTNATDTR